MRTERLRFRMTRTERRHLRRAQQRLWAWHHLWLCATPEAHVELTWNLRGELERVSRLGPGREVLETWPLPRIPGDRAALAILDDPLAPEKDTTP